MLSRRGSIPVGRMIIYLVVVLAAGAGYLAFQRYKANVEESGGELVSPDPAALSKALTDHHRELSVNPGSLTMTDPENLSNSTANWVGTRKTVEDLFGEAAPPKFLGGRQVTVPGEGPAAQLLFTTDEAGGAEKRVSVYLKRYMMAPELPDGAAYTLAGTPHPVVACRRGGFVYYIVGSAPGAISAVREGMSIPAPAQPYPG